MSLTTGLWLSSRRGRRPWVCLIICREWRKRPHPRAGCRTLAEEAGFSLRGVFGAAATAATATAAAALATTTAAATRWLVFHQRRPEDSDSPSGETAENCVPGILVLHLFWWFGMFGLVKVSLSSFSQVFVQQQLPPVHRGQGGPSLPLVLPQLPGALPVAQAPQAVTPEIPLHLRGEQSHACCFRMLLCAFFAHLGWQTQPLHGR